MFDNNTQLMPYLFPKMTDELVLEVIHYTTYSAVTILGRVKTKCLVHQCRRSHNNRLCPVVQREVKARNTIGKWRGNKSTVYPPCVCVRYEIVACSESDILELYLSSEYWVEIDRRCLVEFISIQHLTVIPCIETLLIRLLQRLNLRYTFLYGCSLITTYTKTSQPHSQIINRRVKYLAYKFWQCWLLGGIPPSIIVGGVMLSWCELCNSHVCVCFVCGLWLRFWSFVSTELRQW